MITHINHNPDIYSIHIPLLNNPLKNLNCYVIKTADRSLVVDTGFRRPECLEALREGLKELELDITKTDLFITHLHADHCGLADEFNNGSSVIYMSKIDYDYFCPFWESSSWQEINEYYMKEGQPKGEIEMQKDVNPSRILTAKSLFPAKTFSDGYEFSMGGIDFTTIETPGHTPGHTCLYIKKEKIMFLGDHVLFDITPNIGVWKDVKNSLGDYLKSLDKIKDFDISLALPSHRNNAGDVYARIEAIKNHHKIRLDSTMEIVAKEEGQTAYEIASKMKWSVRGKSWDEIPEFQKWFALSETLAHINYLIEADKLYKIEDNSDNKFKYFIKKPRLSL